MRLNILCILFLLLQPFTGKAQPYLDLGQIVYSASPGGDPKTFNHLRAQVNVPLVLKDSSVFLINPIWEERWIRIDELSSQDHVRGFITWLTYSRGISEKWSAMAAFIPRWNGLPEIQFSEGFQAGCAVLMTYKKRPGLHYKFGLYYNREFWGNFFVPLLGLDWKINNKQRLFGVLPGYFTYENRVSKKFAWGGNFRTFTTSYQMLNDPVVFPPTPYFLRIDDNQLGAYVDVYLTPKLVLNGEAGVSILRKVRKGYGKTSRDEYIVMSNNTAPYLRITMQYRLRFD